MSTTLRIAALLLLPLLVFPLATFAADERTCTMRDAALPASSITYVLCEEGLLLVTNNEGATWTQRKIAEAAGLRALAFADENRGIAILIDQNVQAQDGIFVDFFGCAAATTTVAAALAVRTGCALLPSHTVVGRDGRYRLVYDPIVRWSPSGDRQADIACLTQQLTSTIEGWIREAPEQWLWLHKRWKTRPPEQSA